MTVTRSAISATTPKSCVMNRTPVPALTAHRVDERQDLRLRGHVERGRGLVRDQDLRIQRHGGRDHHALPLAAGQLMRVGSQNPRRIGDPNGREQPFEAAPVHPHPVGIEGFPHLVADAEAWVERAHGLLEDHADLPAPERPERPMRNPQQVRSAEHDLTRRGAQALRQEAHDGRGQRRLARSRLADHAMHLARPEVEREVPDGEAAVRAARAAVSRPGESAGPGRGRPSYRLRPDGEVRSRSPSPNRLTARTMEKRAAPGRAIIQNSKKR